MKVTFPHMGNVYIAAKAFLDDIGVDYIVPPMNSKHTLEIGVKYSPEEICLPFKIQIGNYIESMEKGADTIILPGSCGPCRYGEYCELQMNLLKHIGENIDFVVIDYPGDIGNREFINRIRKITDKSNKSALEKLQAFFYAGKIINLMDALEAKLNYMAGIEIHKGECKQILKSCKQDVMKWKGSKNMYALLKGYEERIEKISVDKNKKPLVISIIGEIYTVIEPSSNLYIEEKLMDYGVSTIRKLSPSWWMKDRILSVVGLNSIDIREAAKEYIEVDEIGGHGIECIGEAVLSAEKNVDGVIQIFPMGCMPEIVSKSILPKISKEKDLPIMTLIVDEMTGEAGYVTRIEAFLDLLERRKKEDVLSWG